MTKTRKVIPFTAKSTFHDTADQYFISILILNTANLQYSKMIFSVSDDGFEWSLDFGTDSNTLTVKDLIQEMIVRSQRICSAARSLFLCQKQDFLKYHEARVRTTPNWALRMKYEVLSSVGAQVMDTNGYQDGDLDDIEFSWEHVFAIFKPEIDTPFSSTAFDDLEMGGSPESPILLDGEEDKVKSPTTPVSERTMRFLALLRRRPFGTRTETVLDFVYRFLFHY